MQSTHDEESPLLSSTVEATNPASARETKSNSFLKATVAVSMATLLVLGMLAYQTSGVLNENVVDVVKSTDLQSGMQAFNGFYGKSTGWNSDGQIHFLDRHNLDCGNNPIRQFKLNSRGGQGGSVEFQYSCANTQNSPTAKYGYNTGWQEYGGVVYMDRQNANCPDRMFMTQFKGSTGNWWWGSRLTFDFQCAYFNVQQNTIDCRTFGTGWNDPGPSNTVIYLDRHNVECPQNMALKGFQGSTGCFGWWCRTVYEYKYTCCSAQTYAPTANPIASPTFKPTNSPIAYPTFSPTKDPTHNPTKEPVADPTSMPVSDPTYNPTDKPSYKPTKEPVASPTQEPTLAPSFEPTQSPIADPTETPTLAPVARPTDEPTRAPVAHPSQPPTLEPTGSPESGPTAEPIAHPTQQPSFEPSKAPISKPTKEPTFEPSKKPTFEPTFEPTRRPSLTPSANPTFEPSQEPTKKPTFMPSQEPTNEPTKKPSLEPTAKPSQEPTYDPSQQPTPAPSKEPTFEPTNEPVSSPTTEPVASPTFEPSAEPTLSPEKPPTNLSPAEQKAFIEALDNPPVVPNAPSEPIVIQPPAEDNDDAPKSPPEAPAAIAVAKEEADVAGSPDVVVPHYEDKPADVKTQYCGPVVYTKGSGPVSVPEGCALLTVDNIDDMANGDSTNAAYICSVDTKPVSVGPDQLEKLGFITDGSSKISYIAPGPLTTIKWFIEKDLTGSSQTYTSSWHPALTNIAFKPSNNKANDAVRSLSMTSKATSAVLPAACN
jgi:hypothetical protein